MVTLLGAALGGLNVEARIGGVLKACNFQELATAYLSKGALPRKALFASLLKRDTRYAQLVSAGQAGAAEEALELGFHALVWGAEDATRVIMKVSQGNTTLLCEATAKMAREGLASK